MPTLLHRLGCYLRIWAFKAFVAALLLVWRAVDPLPAQCAPTMVKTYPVLPKLRHRIFIPPSYEAHKQPLPLYLNIHGGGWTVMDAADDDEFCSYVAATFGVVVVSIAYHLAPQSPFPGPVDNVAAIASAAIADPALPIDRRRIAIGGFSAGGNLALAVSQKPELRSLIRAAVSFFAPLDMATPVSQKLEGRLRPDKPDMLAAFLKIFNDAYIPRGTDLTNPLLSPLYADRDKLPPWLYVIGAEEDCLCKDSQAFAVKASGLPGDSKTLDSDSWEVGKVRWELMRGMAHNFTHLKQRKEVDETRRRHANAALYARIFKWLENGPWA
ncbi:alpha/beta hydrolase fold protein [Apiospora arundinis]